MDNQNMSQNTMPQGSPNPMGGAAPIPPQGGENKSVGALIGSIIIVLILIVGGFYLWDTKVAPVTEPAMMDQGMPVMNGAGQEQASNQQDPVLSQMATVGTNDEVSTIDANLKATQLDGLDSNLQ